MNFMSPCDLPRLWRPVAVLLLAVLCAPAIAAPLCNGPIRFALYENGYLYDASTERGIDKDVALELERRSGCRFEFVVRPQARIWHDLEVGAVAMTGSAVATAERRHFAHFVTYMTQKNFVVVHRAVPARSAAEFFAGSEARWGAVRGYRHGVRADQYLETLRRAGRLAEAADIGEVFRLFARGRTAALLAPPATYARYLGEVLDPGRVRIEDWFPADLPIPHALAFSRQHFSEEAIEGWRRMLRQMREDGSLRNIYAHYLGSEDAARLLAFTPD